MKGVLRLFTGKPAQEGKLDEPNEGRGKVLTVSGVTIANGSDNIGIYIPLFATMVWSEKLLTISLFFIMTFIWCLVAKYAAKHPWVARVIDKYGHLVTPFVLILLGVYILSESGTRGLV